MKIYCLKCGQSTQYSLDVPNFCSKCGKPFKGSSASQAKVKVSKSATSTSVKEEYISDELSSYRHLDSLAFNLEVKKPNVHKLGDILGTDQGEESFERDHDPQYSKENIAEDFLKDAGSIKKNKG